MWDLVKDLESETLSSKEQDREKSELALVKVPESKKRDRETKEAKRKRAKLDDEDIEMALDTKAKKKAKKALLEDNFDDLAHLTMQKFKKQKSSKTSKDKESGATLSSHNGLTTDDFGEDSVLNTLDAEEKASRKKNLRFYASQIVSKAGKRAGAGRDAGGDLDLPYRERRRERELRMRAEALKRRDEGADLDDEEPDEQDRAVAKVVNDDSDNEYYDLLSKTSKKRKEEKKALHDAMRDAEKAGDRADVMKGELGVDGKRAIGWTIQKNKGLTAHRKKEVRNPRVKKRNKYEKAKKKLSSTKAVYKGGQKGAYGGEATGIKTGLVKSVKFAS
jgi:U3 small nucleolar RNA-associated protein 3